MERYESDDAIARSCSSGSGDDDDTLCEGRLNILLNRLLGIEFIKAAASSLVASSIQTITSHDIHLDIFVVNGVIKAADLDSTDFS